MIMLFSALGLLFLAAVGIFIILPIYANTKNVLGNKTIVLLLTAILGITSSLLYYFLGDSRGVYNAQVWQQLESAQKTQEHELRVPLSFTNSLKAQLARHPENGLNWVLLGRIYFSAQDYHDAGIAFQHAYEIYPSDTEILLEYATSLYLAGENSGQAWDNLLMKVTALPQQTIASLSLLANIAFEAGDIKQAITYWQTILDMTPADSALHQALQKTIDQATSSSQSQ